MDPNHVKDINVAPTKMRFAPKASQRRVQKPTVPKREVIDDSEDMKVEQELVRRFNEASMRRSKIDRKVSSSQVAFGFGGDSKYMKSYTRPSDSGGGNNVVREKEYKEPWNYYDYYPVTLPMRRPYSGNPVLLDEDEFTEAFGNLASEDLLNTAMDLGLMHESREEKLLFLQLPTSMPMLKANTEASSSKQSSRIGSLNKPCRLADLPEGFMGKMLVYKSGKVKLKLGDTLYDVSARSDCLCAQNVVAINTELKHCCDVGELTKRAIVTPDVDSILSSMADLE